MESSADPQLHVAYNTPPATPSLLSPPAGAFGDCSPVLSASYADAEGGEGQVAFHVLDSAGNVVVGDWAASSGGKATWRVPRNADGSCKLEAGKTYTWRAIAHDGVSKLHHSASICPPVDVTEARRVSPVTTSATKTSTVPFVSPAMRFEASDSKATQRPSSEIDGLRLGPSACTPEVLIDTRVVCRSCDRGRRRRTRRSCPRRVRHIRGHRREGHVAAVGGD